MKHIIYMATNLVNGKRYIGATRHTLARRKHGHLLSARNKRQGCRKFWAAIRKYGEDGFSWEILADCVDHAEAMAQERQWIERVKPEYNITIGGRGIFGVPRTQIWRDRISAANKGRKLSPEVRAKMKMRSQEHQFKPIVCINDRRKFRSIKEAAKFYQIEDGQISSVLSGVEITAHGRIFIRGTEIPSDDEIAGIFAKAQARLAASIARVAECRSRAVISIGDGVRYKSATAAAKAYGVSPLRITQICQGRGTLKSGARFMYADAASAPIIVRASAEQMAVAREKRVAALRRGQKKIKKGVRCLEYDIVFPSISDVARATGMHISGLSASIYRNGRCGGLTFQFVGG